jgi:hypothetical protein
MSIELSGWLPPMMHVDPWSATTYDELYDEFCRSLKGPLFFLGVRVWYFPEIVDGKEAIFWHLTSKETYDYQPNNRGKKVRIAIGRYPDLPRCQCLAWVKTVLSRCPCPEVKHWSNLEGGGKINTYIWLEDQDFVIVLRSYLKGRPSYRLVTSYRLDGSRSREKMRKRYETRL